MVVQDKESSGILTGLLLQPSEAAGGVIRAHVVKALWPRLLHRHHASQGTKHPGSRGGKFLDSTDFERLLHLHGIQPQSRALHDSKLLLGELRRV